MKKTIYLLSLLFIFLSCYKKTNNEPSLDNNFTINITLKEIKDNTKILLKKQENGISITIDSTYIKDEVATFKGNIDLPQVYGVFIDNNSQGIFPIIEKGEIKISTNLDALYDAKITGTKLNEQLNDYKKKAKNISLKMNELFHEFQKARAENNSEEISKINLKLNSINQELSDYKTNFVKNNSDSFVAAMVLFSLAKNKEISINTIQSLYNNLSNNVKKSEFSKNIKEILDSQKN